MSPPSEFFKPLIRVEWLLGLALAALLYYWNDKTESAVTIAVAQERAAVLSERVEKLERHEPCK